LRMLDESSVETAGLSLAVAAALHYRGPDEKHFDEWVKNEGVEAVLIQATGLDKVSDSHLLEEIMEFYYEIEVQKNRQKVRLAPLIGIAIE
jgi:hypothetical protein